MAIQNESNASVKQNELVSVNVTSDATRVATVADFVRSASAFFDGRQFKLTGVEKRIFLNADEVAKRDEFLASGKTTDDFVKTLSPDKRISVVFTTDIPDDNAVVYLSSYTERKRKLDVGNNVVLRDGSFDKAVYTALAEAKPDDDVFALAQRIFEAFKDKTFTVRRKPYTARTKFGTQTQSVPCFDA